jgi:hypothetical protein
MILLALDPWWNDFYAAGGFFVGVIGFIITIVQIGRARGAAVAARDAANKTLAESKDAYERFIGAFASRFLAELEAAVKAKHWSLAQLRCSDLAELIAALPASPDQEVRKATAEAITSLRDFSHTFAETPSKEPADLSKPNLKKWKLLLQLLHRQLDHLRKPFREKADG